MWRAALLTFAWAALAYAASADAPRRIVSLESPESQMAALIPKDPAEVDKYIADPLCGIRFRPESGASLAALRPRLGDPSALAGVRNNLPVYVFVGDRDPINANMTRIFPLIDMYNAAGLTHVKLQVYQGGRHEMLNETNRDEVMADVVEWLDDHLPDAAA